MQKDIETMHKNQEEMKNTISEMKNILEGIKNKLDEAEGWISELEDKVERNTQSEQQNKKRLKKNEYSFRELQDNMKHNNIHIIGISEEEEKEQGIESLFEKIMAENFPNLVRENVTEVWQTQRVPIKINLKRPTLRHIIIKMANFKDKDRILKAWGEKQLITYKGTPIRLAAYFWTETLQTRRDWHEIFQVVKSKDQRPRLPFPARLLN